MLLLRHPLPKRYYLSMKPYPDRQTAAILRNFSIDIKGGINYRRFENMEARLFQRTVNEPCSSSVRTSLSGNSFTLNNCSERIGVSKRLTLTRAYFQTTNFIRQTSTCEMQELRVSGEVGLLMAEVASLVAARTDINISGNRLSANDPQNFIHHMAIANTTWDYLEVENWNPYNISIQRYMEDTRGLLDNQMIQHWSPYTLLLERMLENPWLATARRAMNATNEVLQSPEIGRFSVRSPSASGYFAVLTPADPREVEALTFAGFLGISQPANARYAEARMWNRNTNEVSSLREWINIAYLRVFLLVLDAYLIVSRFYSACRNFCALWLGKRRRVYHNTNKRSAVSTKRRTLNEHSNDALLLTSSEIEQPNSFNETDPPACPATRSAENNPSKYFRSALLSRVEAMDDYRRHMRAMVHYVQLHYLNSQRLPLERNKATRQLRRLQRIQHWLYYEKEHILRQNLYEVCALSESTGRNQQSFYVLDSSICHRIRQDQHRRQQSPYSNMALRKPQKSTISFMSSQEQLKLPFCTLLPVHSADALNASLSSRERHTILGTEKSTSILSEQELRQLHQMFFKNSAFAAFLTSLYRLLFTSLLLSMCVCWLLACKHLIMQMAARTVAVVTSKVTVISPCPPEIRRIETFIHSSDSSLSFHRPAVESVAPTRLNIWHFDDDPSEDLQDSHCSPALGFPPHVPKHSAPHSLTSSVSCKASKKHFHFKGKSIQTKIQTDSAESQV
ncbi:unnamed protein product [Taenia asiatica]|uniref:Uncharacterized protein n=1 Tax=Taenia asiatica TaxID=60517 RepID=A0A158R6F2_TAEAS|nr:unnamed protein product [Taenia asiatica]